MHHMEAIHPIADSVKAAGNQDDAEYDAYLARIKERYNINTMDGTRPVFDTDVEGLFPAYLETFPEDLRQYHTCNACRRFIEHFGGLVTIEPDGTARSAVWDAADAPPGYAEAARIMAAKVAKARVTGPFLSRDRVWGTPVTGIWHHLSLNNPVPKGVGGAWHALQTPFQVVAEKREDFKNVMRALDDFPARLVKDALTIAQAEAFLYRAEKVLEPLRWLSKLHDARMGKTGNARSNVVWLAVTDAPAGFAHPRSSMAGTLLEDLATGMSAEAVAASFRKKMDPLRYQRPQNAPTTQAIEQAERAFAKLGLAPALLRRYAKVHEVKGLWFPQQPKAPRGHDGVFGSIKARDAAPARTLNVPAQTLTWAKFRDTVLPQAEAIELVVPKVAHFVGITTAEEPDAPPILQWDLPEERNPFSWYMYHGGSPAARWTLRAGAHAKVTAVTLQPPMWATGEPPPNQSKGVVFVLEGARDTGNPGVGLFPEILRSEVHPFRAVIEAYSNNAELSGREDATACGVALVAGGGGWNARLRVTAGNTVREYTLDRWD